MSEIILHHYPNSPFAEIIRLTLGLKGLAWRSVIQSNMMPRPHLSPLTGGYRRIPVLQIGADCYCDTQIILRELDRRFPNPPLEPAGQEGLGWALRHWAGTSYFQACVAIIFGTLGEHVPKAFIEDREKLSGRPFDVAAMKAVAPMMKDQWRAQAAWIDARAKGGGFLLGDQPGLADVSCAMPFWFLRSGLAPVFEELTADLPAARAWFARVEALGHGTSSPLTPEEALAIAKDATPAPALPGAPEPQGFGPGDRVIVMADDYGRDPIEGIVSHCSANRIALARETVEAGAIVTHFPRAGFLVRRV
jgi:glutathione S-transferase